MKRVNPLGFLTTRGKIFLAVGILGTVTALSIGQRDMSWIFLFLGLLPVVCLVIVAQARISMSCERRIEPARVTLGEPMTGMVRLTKTSSWPIGLLRFEERVPRELGRRPRFGIHRFWGSWTRVVSYPLTGMARGRFTVGPLLVSAIDPFGMTQINRRFSGVSQVMVTPKIYHLPTLTSGVGSGRMGEAAAARMGLTGQDDVMVREYRIGDSVRRVHWPSTARHGDLMVRREEQSWDATATVLVDTRSSAHAGTGGHSSLEWAISAAASVGFHLTAHGYGIRLVDADGNVTDTTGEDPESARERLITTLTDQAVSTNPRLSDKALYYLSHRAGQLIVVIVGRLNSDDTTALVSSTAQGSTALAMVLDVTTFAGVQPEGALADRVARLQAAGWLATGVDAAMSPTDAWTRLDREGVAAA